MYTHPLKNGILQLYDPLEQLTAMLTVLNFSSLDQAHILYAFKKISSINSTENLFKLIMT